MGAARLAIQPFADGARARIERTPEAAQAGLRGTLATALDLSREDPAAEADETLLRAGVISLARQGLVGFQLAPAVLAGASAGRGVLLAFAALVPMVLTVALAPKLARTGVQRVLTPWTGEQWPKRTAMVDATGVRGDHPIGTSVTLRAMVTETDRRLGRTDVWANYPGRSRGLDRSRGAGSRRSSAATCSADEPDARSVEARVTGSSGASQDVLGEPYERLLDPAGLGVSGDLSFAGGSAPSRPEPGMTTVSSTGSRPRTTRPHRHGS